MKASAVNALAFLLLILNPALVTMKKTGIHSNMSDERLEFKKKGRGKEKWETMMWRPMYGLLIPEEKRERVCFGRKAWELSLIHI